MISYLQAKKVSNAKDPLCHSGKGKVGQEKMQILRTLDVALNDMC